LNDIVAASGEKDMGGAFAKLARHATPDERETAA
jgi:hypothetical protein